MEKENLFFTQLIQLLAERPNCELHEKVHYSKYIYDAVIVRNGEIIAIIEFKVTDIRSGISNLLENIPKSLSCKYLISSNGKEHILYNRFTKKFSVVYDILALLDSILEVLSLKDITKYKGEISTIIEDIIQEECKKPFWIEKKLSTVLTQHFSRDNIIRSLIFDRNGQFFHFSQDIRDMNNFENTFFKFITEQVKSSEIIYRYISLESLFHTLNNKFYRLNGIIGMNDISEIGYVETYLDKTFNPLDDISSVNGLNKRFILCCSTLDDDLTQWRLYGDDCKGACLVFTVDNNSNIPGLQLRKISYGQQKNGQNYHPELELVKSIIEAVASITGQSVRFRTLAIWKHFFKSYEYSSEKEVRLLVILNSHSDAKGGLNHNFDKKWCLTQSHQILMPYITTPINSSFLPIKLQKIVLGSKCSERETNHKQLLSFLDDIGLSKINVGLSKISNYR